MAVHYTRERSKYGTLTGSIIIWPVEITSPNNPNNEENIDILPAGYLRCDGTKYNARDYPNLAEICGTGNNCKFLKFDENDDPLITLGDDEFVVPDLGSKYPRPVSGGDAGTFNNILTENQNGNFIKRSGIGIEATSNVGQTAEVTYTGKFIVPAQTIPLKGKPSWTWGDLGYTDSEAVDASQMHPHMHFSNTSRVRIKPKSAATGGVIPLDDIFFDANNGALNSQYNGTSFVSYGTGQGEAGGFTSPGFGSGYVAFGGPGGLQITREWTVTVTNPGYNLLAVTSISGNDTNGGERPNNPGEGIYVIWPDNTQSSSPILPSRQESGLSVSQFDSQYTTWLTQTLPIPEAYKNGTFTIKFRQVVQATGSDDAGNPNFDGDEQNTQPYIPNAYDTYGIARVGFSGGYTEDTSLTGGENDLPAGINYFRTASTIDVEAWLNATKASSPTNSSPGSGQPACWAIASGSLAGTQKSSQQLLSPIPFPIFQVTQRWGWCDSGCSLSNLRCYCLLTNSVSYQLSQDWFGITGTRYSNSLDSLGICTPLSEGVPYNNQQSAPATYQTGKTGVPSDWKGISLSDVLPLSSQFINTNVFPQAKNVSSETDEVDLDGDPTIHNHKITVVRETHTFEIVTDPFLIEPDNLNTTLLLDPSTAASIDSASSPFIVLEYLIKT
jgi:hypothetical protein